MIHNYRNAKPEQKSQIFEQIVKLVTIIKISFGKENNPISQSYLMALTNDMISDKFDIMTSVFLNRRDGISIEEDVCWKNE